MSFAGIFPISKYSFLHFLRKICEQKLDCHPTINYRVAVRFGQMSFLHINLKWITWVINAS